MCCHHGEVVTVITCHHGDRSSPASQGTAHHQITAHRSSDSCRAMPPHVASRLPPPFSKHSAAGNI